MAIIIFFLPFLPLFSSDWPNWFWFNLHFFCRVFHHWIAKKKHDQYLSLSIWIQFANIRDIHTHTNTRQTNAGGIKIDEQEKTMYVCTVSEWVSELVSEEKKNSKRSGNISHFLSLFFLWWFQKKVILESNWNVTREKKNKLMMMMMMWSTNKSEKKEKLNTQFESNRIELNRIESNWIELNIEQQHFRLLTQWS